MSQHLITNQEKFLSEVINDILPGCDKAYFLVGYFYFSGFQEIYEKLQDKHLRILVGLDIERSLANGIREIDDYTQRTKTRVQTRDEYYQGLVDIFNNTDFFDTERQIEAFKLFCDKIANGTLEIRKTLDPNHAKLYLFEYKPEHQSITQQPGQMITGSSNLSVAGLKGRIELNTILRDPVYYNEGKELFDKLWETAVPVADLEHLPEFTEKVIKKIWMEKLYSPYAMFIRILQEYFSQPDDKNLLKPSDITDGIYTDLKYQLDAVQMAMKAIENHDGVIIADVVGLGKSIIASTVARNLHLRTIIVSPPHLKQQWEEYRDQFGFTASVFSSGKIEAALDHYRMIVRNNEQFLIIVDEAHKYKNEDIQDYSILHDLCMGNKVMLLTATPFNNRPNDIFSMLKLFQIPSKSTLKTVDDLGVAFRDLIKKYEEMAEAQRKKTMTDAEIKAESKRIAKQIRSIISPLVIRRSRLDLDEIPAYKADLKAQKIKTVIPEDPVSLTYNLGGDKDLYLRTLSMISPTAEEKLAHKDDESFVYYKSARYKPSSYLTDDAELLEQLKRELEDKTGISLQLLLGRQASVSDFMRKMLVRRFESSVAAFKESLNSMIQSSESILRWIEKRDKIPVYKKGSLPDVDEFYETTDDDLSQEIEEAFEKYTDRGFFEIDMKYIKRDEYLADMLSDLNLLQQIQEEWFGKDQVIRFDHKLTEFKAQLRFLRASDPKRKIVVFTEFADTANYLGESLKGEGLGIFKYTSGDSSTTSKKTIRENFDAGLKLDFQKDDYQVLIATDAISEGYNLHRAGTVFNYDIPYNPTRVIQRIGRINRINKKMFDKLYIYNYFPTDIGEQETRTKQISTLKMAMIHAIMGEDTKALTSDEELNAFFKERYRKELASSEELSWDTKYRRILDSVKNTDIYQEAMSIPHRSRIGRKVEKPIQGVILCDKKGNDFVFKVGQADDLNPISISAEDALGIFEAEETEAPVAVSKGFEPVYQTVKSKLFKDTVDGENERSRREAYSIIKAWQKNKILSTDYLEDLLLLMRNDGLTGEEIRFINKLKPKNADTLPKKITPDYIKRCIMKMNAVDEGEETLILAEEIQ
ncbi:MAG: helicase [Bacteroidales bacterium]|nr:helicase [Bacteroidales bacterium]